MQNCIKVLIVEDEAISASYLKKIIEEDTNYKVIAITHSAKSSLEAIQIYKPQVVFVDIMIKGQISGAELALQIYILYEKIKIVFITAYSEDEIIEYAQKAHAFAYLLKPYRPKQILAILTLLKSYFQKYIPLHKEKLYLKDGYIYNFTTRCLSKNGTKIPLTPKESELLDLLCKHSNKILSIQTIIQTIKINKHSLRTLIYRLRKHLSPNTIINFKSRGYKIVSLSK